MKNLIYLSVVALFFCACSQFKTEHMASSVLNMDEFESNPHFTFDNPEFIPLETNDSCLISNINKIIYHNNFYYLLDKSASAIFIYSEAGKFIDLIHRVGNGPSEYVTLKDFDVDDQKNIYVSCGETAKIIKYLYPAYQEFEEYSLGIPFMEFAVDRKNHHIWLANILDYAGCKQLALYSNGEITVKLEPRKVFDDVEKPFKNRSFYRSGEHLYFNSRYSPIVYDLANDSIEPIAEIHSSHCIKEADLSGNHAEPETKNAIAGFSFFCRINNLYVGELRYFPWSSDFVIYDIHKQTGKLVRPIPADPEVFTQNNDCVVGIMAANVFKQYYSKYAENVDESDNPVLVKVKFVSK